MPYVYFLKSQKNGKVYTGFSRIDPKERLREHNTSKGNWTRLNGPFDLVYFEEYHCEKDARTREIYFKTGFGRRIRDAILREVVNN